MGTGCRVEANALVQSRSRSESLVRLRQTNATECVGKVLCQVLPVGWLNTSSAFANETKFREQVEADRVPAAQIEDHLVEAKSYIRWKEVPAPNAASTQGSLDVGGLEDSLIDQ